MIPLRLSLIAMAPLIWALVGCPEGSGPGGAPAQVQARCEETCDGAWTCENVRGDQICTRACADDEACAGGICLLPEGRCAAASGRVGALCSDDDHCHPGLSCLSANARGACSKACGVGDGCPPEGWNVCIRLEPPEAGTLCLRRCGADTDCAEGLACVWLVEGSYGVCFP